MDVGPRRRTSAYAPPGGPTRYNTVGTSGTGYGYTNQQGMQGNYAGSNPAVAPYGYAGQSSYGHSGSSGKSNAMMYAGGGLLAGAAVGVGGYYMYQRMMRSECEGYSCCYGCSNQCYGSLRRNCRMGMNRRYYQDDLMMDSGFFPSDEKPWPLSIRIWSVAGTGYPSGSICPPTSCSDGNVASCNTTDEVPADLFVTLTVLENLSPNKGAVASGSFSAGLWLPVLVLAHTLLRRRVF